MGNLRHDFFSTGLRCCKRCGAPFNTKNRDGKCPGWPLRGAKKVRAKKKKPKKRQSYNFYRSRYGVGVEVVEKATGEIGKVVAHVRRKRRWREQNLWRQTPVVRFDGPRQRTLDDDDLELA